MQIQKTLLTGTILTGLGLYKTIKDSFEAPKDKKIRTIIRDTTSLSIATGVVFTSDKLMAKYLSNKNLQNLTQKFSKKIIEHKSVQKVLNFINPNIKLKPMKLQLLSEIITSSFKSASLLFLALCSGLLAGEITDKILSKINPQKEKELNNYQFENGKIAETFEKFSNNKVFEKVANEKNKALFLNAAGVFESAGIINNPFEKPLVIVNGITMANSNQGIKKTIEQSSVGILTEVIVPTIIISISNALTQNKNLIARFSAIASSFYLGNIAGNYIGKKLTKEN